MLHDLFSYARNSTNSATPTIQEVQPQDLPHNSLLTPRKGPIGSYKGVEGPELAPEDTPEHAAPVKVKETFGVQNKNIHNLLKASYLSGHEHRAKLLKKLGYDYRKDLSGGKHVTAIQQSTGKPVVIYRGSADMRDWRFNAKYAASRFLGVGNSKNMTRARRAQRDMQKVQQATGRDDIVALGHSLGGFLAQRSGAPGGVITYNKYSLGDDEPSKRQKDFRAKGDIASLFRKRNKYTREFVGKNPWLHPIGNHTVKSKLRDAIS